MSAATPLTLTIKAAPGCTGANKPVLFAGATSAHRFFTMRGAKVTVTFESISFDGNGKRLGIYARGAGKRLNLNTVGALRGWRGEAGLVGGARGPGGRYVRCRCCLLRGRPRSLYSPRPPNTKHRYPQHEGHDQPAALHRKP